MILAGDIGGTNTRLAYFDDEAAPTSIEAPKVYSSRQFTSLASIVEDFLHRNARAIGGAAFGVAGRSEMAGPRSRTSTGTSTPGGSHRSLVFLPALTEGGFMEAFVDKGRMKALLERVPVRVIRQVRFVRRRSTGHSR